jgi:hypothetical protein
VTRARLLFDNDHLAQTRSAFLREARALPPGSELNQKRQIARSLKRLLEIQIRTQDSRLVKSRLTPHPGC